MPLDVLLVLVVGGISGIALLLHLSGRSKLLYMTAEDARAAWHRHAPDDLIQEVTVASNGHAALVTTQQGMGLVWAFGADSVARPLHDFDLLDTRDGLRIAFHDFSAPEANLKLTEAERDIWRSRLRPQ